jgi:hypothetical protein
MNRRLLLSGVLACALLASTSACAVQAQPSPPRPPFTPVVDMKELMVSVVQPAADNFWGILGETVTEKGVVDLYPKTDEEWVKAHQNATWLAEMGNLLMIDGRAPDNDAWMMRSAEFIEVSAQILKAVDTRDRARMEDLATELDQSCSACHQKYMRGVGSGPAR